MQDDSMDRYLNLFSNYPPLTPEEQKAFEELINSNLPEDLWKEISDPKRILQEMRNISALDQNKEAYWGNLMEQKMGMAATETKPVVRVLPWRRYMVAASIFLVLTFGGYWWFQPSRQQPEGQAQMPRIEKQDSVVPGSYKARLTLSDGSVVVLDSAAMGKLATQGQASIQNNKGQLIYEGKTGTEGVLYNTLTTGRGETYSVVLGDGTKVWLNAASSLRYPLSFPGSDRKVELIGEAYFEVVTSSNQDGGKQPFIVSHEDVNVTVLGTRFDFNAYEDDGNIKVTLLEGSVKVTSQKQRSAGVILNKIIKPGQQAVIKADKINVIDDTDVNQAIAWKNGWFIFKSTNIQLIMRQMERWYDLEPAQYTSEEVRTWNYNGEVSRYNNISTILDFLEITGGGKFRVEGKKIIISK